MVLRLNFSNHPEGQISAQHHRLHGFLLHSLENNVPACKRATEGCLVGLGCCGFDPSCSIFTAFPTEMKQERGCTRPALGAAAPCPLRRDDGGSARMPVM